MNQRELNREVATATGETVTTIAELGFVPLTLQPFESESPMYRDPLMVDWDRLEAEREVLHPVG